MSGSKQEKDRNNPFMNTIEDSIYKVSRRDVMKIVVVGMALLLMAFFTRMSLLPMLESKAAQAIAKGLPCPVGYQKTDFSFFPPSFQVIRPRMSGTCIGKPNLVLSFKELKVGPGLPSFNPLGLTLSTTLIGQGSDLHIRPVIGFKQQVRFANSRLSSRLFNTLLGQGNIFAGGIFVDGFLEFEKQRIGRGQFKLTSKTLEILPREIKAGHLPFTLPSFRIENLLVETKIAKNKVLLKSLTVGVKNKTPLFANFKGTFSLNRLGTQITNVDIVGDLKISDELLNGSFSILKLFWKLKSKKGQEAHKIKFSGPPATAFLKPTLL